jgi:hypothetical protein
MGFTFLAFVLDDPAEVRDAKVDGSPHAGKLRVVNKDDAASFSRRPE